MVKHFSVCLEGERDREDDLDKHFTKAYEKITIHDLAASSASSSDENLASKQLQSNSVLSSIDSTSGDSAKPSRDGKSQTSSENAVIYLNKHIENKAVRDDSSSTHEQIDDSDENLQNNEEIFEIKNAEIHSDNSSASSPSSISDQSDAEESDVMLRNQVKDDVILDDVQANSSTQNEPELGPVSSLFNLCKTCLLLFALLPRRCLKLQHLKFFLKTEALQFVQNLKTCRKMSLYCVLVGSKSCVMSQIVNCTCPNSQLFPKQCHMTENALMVCHGKRLRCSF